MLLLLGLSKAVPHQKYATEELIELFPCELPSSVKQNISNLGVYTRYLAVPTNFPLRSESALNDAGLDVCVEACKSVLRRLGISIEDINYFIATYDASPFLCPGLSSLLVRRLGFTPSIKHVSLQGTACTAFTRALELAEDHLANSPQDYVMICLSGINSYWFHNQVKGMKNVMGIKKIQALKNEKRRRELRKWIATLEFFLFGDGAASMIIAREGKGSRITDIAHVTNLRKTDYLAGYTRLTILNKPFSFGFRSHLDKNIRKLGLKYTSAVLEKLFGEHFSEHDAKVKKWVVHTGSKAVLDSIAENYSIKHEKLKESYEVLAEYGNLAGASLPFILERIMQEGKLQEDDQVIVLGFGWGFSSSACSIVF